MKHDIQVRSSSIYDKQASLKSIRQHVIAGDEHSLAESVQEALAADLDPLDIIDESVMPGVKEVGNRFESGEIFLPQLMMTGQAVKRAMGLLGPAIQECHSEEAARAREKGTVVMATVQTDIHDIGKNLVSLMLEAASFRVVDLGVDVPLKAIVAKAKEVEADIIACSALLTTSMPYMRDLVDLLEAMNERGRFKVMVGGASVTPEFAESIGADGTAPDAAAAVRLAERLVDEEG